MGKIIDNKDGTHSMNGFSNNSEEDMRELGDKFISIESKDL